MYILIELSELIGVGYDLSDTQDGPIRCWRYLIYFFFLTSPYGNDSGERFWAHEPSSFYSA